MDEHRFTGGAGIVGEAPPRAIVRRRIPGMGRLRVRRRRRRRSMEELFHWGYGAAALAVDHLLYGLVLSETRRRDER